jgi:hypothetical protein
MRVKIKPSRSFLSPGSNLLPLEACSSQPHAFTAVQTAEFSLVFATKVHAHFRWCSVIESRVSDVIDPGAGQALRSEMLMGGTVVSVMNLRAVIFA